MYGWFSDTQRNRWNDFYLERTKHKNQKKYIYYLDMNDNIVEITEITRDKNYKSNFDDVIYLGKMKKFYKICSTRLCEENTHLIY